MTIIDIYIAFVGMSVLVIGAAIVCVDEKKCRDKMNARIIKQYEDKFWNNYEKNN
jgi:hypothetical protein